MVDMGLPVYKNLKSKGEVSIMLDWIRNVSLRLKVKVVLLLLMISLILSLYLVVKITYYHIFSDFYNKHLGFFYSLINNKIEDKARYLDKLSKSRFIKTFLLNDNRKNNLSSASDKKGQKNDAGNLDIFMDDFDVDLIYLMDENKNIGWGKYRNPVTHEKVYISGEMKNDLMNNLNRISVPSRGVIFMNKIPFIVSIQRNSYNAKNDGQLVIMGLLFFKQLNYIEHNYDLALGYITLNKKSNESIPDLNNIRKKNIPLGKLKAFTVYDIFGNPSIEIHASTKNYTRFIEDKVLRHILSIMIFIIVVLIVSVIVMFERIGIRRMNILNKQINKVIGCDIPHSKVDEDGNDEIGKLQKSINYLLEVNDRIKISLRKDKTNLMKLVDDKTRELVTINGILYKKLKEHSVMENVLKESEERYKKVVDNALEGIVIIQGEIIIFANEKLLKIIDLNKDEILNRNFIDFVYEEDKRMVKSLYESRISGKVMDDPNVIRLEDGNKNIHWTEISSVLINLQGVDSLLVFISDITEKKYIEKEHEKLQKQLLQAQKMEAIGRLAGGIAHDFNNILTPIIGYSELIMIDDELPDKHKEYITEIKKSAERASSLTKQLLVFSRRQEQSFEIINVNKVIKNMEKLFRRLINETVTLKTDLKPELKLIKADRGKIEQVLMNLVINASDAMPDGGVIYIKTENMKIEGDFTHISPDASEGDFVVITVEDNGVGMDEKTKEKIFEPFFTTKGIEKGTGLGLAVVYGIVHQCKGWINVYSEPGYGSKFQIYLPSLVSDENYKSDYDDMNYNWKEIRGNDRRILIVEDDENILNYTGELLKGQGYKVYTAKCSEDAMKIIEKERGMFDLVFSDIIMPGGSGLDLINEINRKYPDIRILLTSGYSPDDQLKLVNVAKSGYTVLMKPYMPSDLLRHIDNELNKGNLSL